MILRPIKGVAIEETDFDKIRFPIYGSRKIDGFRCVLAEHPLTSRLSRFPNEYFHKSLSGLLGPSSVLDAEVTVGPRKGAGVLQRTSSGLTSREGEPDFRLYVFDAPLVRAGFAERQRVAREIVQDLAHPQIKFLKQYGLQDRAALEEFLDRSLELGYEGIILRSMEGPYKFGKSTLREQYMLKVKPFDTEEGRIKGWFEEEENTNEAKREKTGKLKRSSAKAGKRGKGRLGGFILDDVKTGVEVRVGGGFTQAQRIALWRIAQENPKELMNELVTYKKQRVGEKDKPRHPGFVDFVTLRPSWDFTED